VKVGLVLQPLPSYLDAREGRVEPEGRVVNDLAVYGNQACSSQPVYLFAGTHTQVA